MVKTIAAGTISPFVRHAARAGWSEEALSALCARHGINRAVFDDITAYVPEDGALALLEEICAQSDENLGLHLAREADPTWLSLPGIVGVSLTSVREAIEVVTHYDSRRLSVSVLKGGCRLGEDGLLHMIHVPDPDEPSWPRQFVEACVAVSHVLLQRFTGAEVKAVRVSFPHAAPADVGAHVALFGTTDIQFEAPCTGVVLPASVLDLRLQSAHPGLATFLRRQADALVEQMAGDDIVSEVRKVLRDALERGAEASLGSAAQRFGTTSRTLQRRLADAGARFSVLLERVRCEMAIELLERSGADMNDIAERVGFSDARSLRRALKRRTGRSPSKLRKKAASA